MGFDLMRALSSELRIGPVNVSESDYRQAPGVNQSTLKKMGMSAAKCLWELEHPRPASEAQELGTAIHAALLEPEVFSSNWVVRPKFDRRTKAGKQAFDEWSRANEGKRSVDQEDMDTINRVSARVFDNDFYAKFFRRGQKEVSFWSMDAELQRMKKCRLDNYIGEEDIIVDLKTTDCAFQPVFARDIWKYQYHVQAAWYVDVVKEVTGRECSFFIVAVEKSKDCDVTVHLVGQEALAHGRALYRNYFREYVKAVNSNRWDGYEQVIHKYEVPAWAIEEEGLEFDW